MFTKIVAARLATSAGVTTVITRSSNPNNIVNIVRYLQGLKSLSQPASPKASPRTSVQPSDSTPDAGSLAKLTLEHVKAPLHTRFMASPQPIRDRYFWLLHGLAPHGTIYIDSGAHRALANKSGLLPVGVVDVEGSFAQQEAVRIVVVNRIIAIPGLSPGSKTWDGTPIEVGRALVNYSSIEISRIKGLQSTEITGLLGYADSEYIALRDNISLFRRESRPATPNQEV